MQDEIAPNTPSHGLTFCIDTSGASPCSRARDQGARGARRSGTAPRPFPHRHPRSSKARGLAALAALGSLTVVTALLRGHREMVAIRPASPVAPRAVGAPAPRRAPLPTPSFDPAVVAGSHGFIQRYGRQGVELSREDGRALGLTLIVSVVVARRRARRRDAGV